MALLQEAPPTKTEKRNVIATGFTSLFQDISSEMIFPILPLFLSDTLGANKAIIGLIEGVAESVASLLKIVSGVVSDKIGKRKPLILLGYGLATITRPFLAIATAWQTVLGVRFFDRVGKGIRGAPRDALIADSTAPHERGKWFGFHRAMDTAGAVIGTLITTLLLAYVTKNYRTIFWIAVIPGIIAVLSILFIKEKQGIRVPTRQLSLSLKNISAPLKRLMLATFVFSLGNFSYSFLILKAEDLGISKTLIPIVYLVYNIVYVLSTIPAGRASDAVGRKKVLLVGFGIYCAVCVGFMLVTGSLAGWILFAIYGIGVAINETLSRTFIADLAPAHVKGSVMGMYHLLVGIAVFPANALFGLLWNSYGSGAAFLYGAITAALAILLTLFFVRESKPLTV